jgi:FkbM family methyltransferase
VNAKLDQTRAAGQQPARFGSVVRLIRRFLWPFVRPYHRRQLETLNEVIDAGQHRAEIAQVARDLAGLRGDVRAVANRLAPLESQGDAARRNTFLANTHAGLLYLASGDLVCEAVARTGGWDTHLLPVLDEAAQAGVGTAIDAGAHVGIHTLAMAAKFQRVLAFEANPFVFRLLRANVTVNATHNVTCHNTCLYSREVEIALGGAEDQEIDVPWLTGESWEGADRNLGALCFVPGGSEVFRSTSRTIDSYELEDLRFLKVDCQGADGEVLMGALETIRRCRPIIVFEWESILARHHSVQLDDLKSELESCGYDFAELHRHTDKQIDYVARPR